ncbi:MAG: hypothetical protein ACFE9S_13005 [Candidatus Hermodarchaeota archaeon]
MVFDWNFYFSLFCSIGGIAFFLISLLIIRKIKELFPATKLIKKWIIIQVLIFVFLGGYVANIIFLALELTIVTNIMVAIVYIFGALFVLLVVNLSYKTYKEIVLGSSKK